MSPRGGWNAAVLLLVASVGSCGSEPEPAVGVDDALTASWSAEDTACTTVRLSTTGNADGKQISLADAPLSCGPTLYTSTSSAAYGGRGCDGYVVELAGGVMNLPRAGETVRVVNGLNPKLSLVLNQSQCESLTFQARAYIHGPSLVSGGWSRYGGVHQYKGTWSYPICHLTAADGNGEIPPFPASIKRDKIRIVVKATTNGQQSSVMAGVKLGTCPSPNPKPAGELCDADDECVGHCGAGTCCGSSKKTVCDWADLLQQ